LINRGLRFPQSILSDPFDKDLQDLDFDLAPVFECGFLNFTPQIFSPLFEFLNQKNPLTCHPAIFKLVAIFDQFINNTGVKSQFSLILKAIVTPVMYVSPPEVVVYQNLINSDYSSIFNPSVRFYSL